MAYFYGTRDNAWDLPDKAPHKILRAIQRKQITKRFSLCLNFNGFRKIAQRPLTIPDMFGEIHTSSYVSVWPTIIWQHLFLSISIPTTYYRFACFAHSEVTMNHTMTGYCRTKYEPAFWQPYAKWAASPLQRLTAEM